MALRTKDDELEMDANPAEEEKRGMVQGDGDEAKSSHSIKNLEHTIDTKGVHALVLKSPNAVYISGSYVSTP